MRCLDTNVVNAVPNDSSSRVTTRFDALAFTRDLARFIIVLFELDYGLAKSTRRGAAERRLATLLDLPLQILPLGQVDAEHATGIRADLERTPIGPTTC